jgi:hypothetical protein
MLRLLLLAFRAETFAEKPKERGKPEDDRNDAEDGADRTTKEDG